MSIEVCSGGLPYVQEASLKGKNQRTFQGIRFFEEDHPQGGLAAFSLTPRENFPMLAPRKITSYDLLIAEAIWHKLPIPLFHE